MEQEVAIVVDDDTRIFPCSSFPGVRPILEIGGPGPANAVLFVETPPFARDVLVLHKIRIDHSAHLGDRNIRAFHPQNFRTGPAMQILTGHGPDARVSVPVSLAVWARVGLRTENPTPLVANYISRRAKVQVLIARRNCRAFSPMSKITAFGPCYIRICDPILLGLNPGEV